MYYIAVFRLVNCIDFYNNGHLSHAMFLGFMTSGIDDDPSVKSEVESISEYYYAVNRRKFTRERCEQLSALLGSSLEDDSASTLQDEHKDINVVDNADKQTSAHVHEQPTQSTTPCSSASIPLDKNAKTDEAIYKCRKFAMKQWVLNSIYEVPDITMSTTNVDC